VKTDVTGRLRNIQLPYAKALLPLFEAVVNSIHSIEDAKIKNGKIDVFIIRGYQQAELFSDLSFTPIQGFKVVDNGVGFDEKNYSSFQTADSTFKISKGSKGIGRFLWLKAFDHIKIDSIYQQNTKFFQRKFNFKASNEGISHHENDPIEADERSTTVELSNFNPKYQEKCPQSAELIAKRIIEHCLIYFISENPPIINVIDEEKITNLNNYFNEEVKPNSTYERLILKSEEFLVLSIRLYRAESSEHKLHYCAQNREVYSEKLSKYIPDLADSRKLKDEKGHLFTYVVYVLGKYLDERVNSERTDFHIIKNAEDDDIDFFTEIAMNELREKVLNVIKNYLEPFLSDIREHKEEQIRRYVFSNAPQYRPLLKHHPEILKEIPPSLSEDKLDIELYRQYSQIEISLRKKSTEILATTVDDFTKYPEYRQKYHQFLEQFNDFGKSKLAEYIIHRKTILELFDKNLKRDDTGRYKLEKNVHEIIFPLKRTSDDIDFEKQNLWIIDEKLAYHSYLASDQPLNQLSELSVDSEDRPDLLVFNNPFAFVEGSQPYSSIVIIEFKRPMRKTYEDTDNPINQVYKYVKKIKSGNFQDKDGRLVNLPDTTPFYGYIICDLTPKIKEFAETADFIDFPDLQGYFGYNKKLNTYVEILSFDKLVYDAKKRNKTLFDRLQLL
jgi:hypothetical protein